jgi:hypothetical protein
MRISKWHVFLSYASEDRDTVAFPIYETLAQRKLKVWIDEHELTVGDSLKDKIEHGLLNSRFGIVVLSPNFFAKKWPRRELNALLALEQRTKKKLLPVWHEIEHDDIAAYSPLLAERVGIKTHTGFRSVCEAIVAAMRREHRALAASLRRAEQAHLADGLRKRTHARAHIAAATEYFAAVGELVASSTVLPCYWQPRPSKTTPARIASGLAAMRYFVDSVLHKHRASNFLLVGINRGGSAIATYIMESLNISRDHLLLYEYLVNFEMPVAGGRPRLPSVDVIFLVDDIVRTGRTLVHVRKQFEAEYPKASVYATTLNVREEALALKTGSGDTPEHQLVDYAPVVGYVSHDDLPWNVGLSRDVYAYLSEQLLRQAESRFD